MLFLIRNSAVRQALARNAGEYITVNNWAVKEAIYIELVDSLTHNNNKDVARELCTTRNERQSTV